MIAWLALLSWPIVVIVLYRRLPPDRALIWAILGGYLLLPPLVSINLPVVPDLNKWSLPTLMALALAMFSLKDRISLLPDSAIGKALVLIYVVSPFATVLVNPEPLQRGPELLPGMRIYDSVAAVANQMIEILPFFLARRYLATPEAMRALLVALLAAGLAYSIPMLIEIRLSPQMNVWVYGFFQHDFFQTIRGGSYRPVVFLPHGLWVAFFALMAAMSAMVLAKAAPKDLRPKLMFATLYLLVILVLCRSMGVLIYAAVLTPLILFAPPRTQVLVAAGLAVVVITYPLLRGAQIIPIERITEFARGFSSDRAYSFQFRVRNEEALLTHAAQKSLFGWGGYGRNLLHDPTMGGSNVTIADGAWIITLGIYGWAGYLAQFGLLVLPLLQMGRAALRKGLSITAPVAGVCLICAANLVDLLPNATLIPFTWLMAGAILGHAEGLVRGGFRETQAVTGWQPAKRRTVI